MKLESPLRTLIFLASLSAAGGCDPRLPQEGATAPDAAAPAGPAPAAGSPDAAIPSGDAVPWLEKFTAAGGTQVVNVWANWCLPCVEELPQFIELYGRSKAAGLNVLLINVDRLGGDSAAATAAEKTAATRKQLGISSPLFIHTGALAPLAKALGSSTDGPPITAVFKNGRLLRTVDGAFEKGGLAKLIDELKALAP